MTLYGMEIANIRDRILLENWLRKRPVDDGVQIAFRAALRVFPIFAESVDHSPARKGNLTPLPILRALLITAVARKYTVPEAAVAAARDAYQLATAIEGSSGPDLAATAVATAATVAAVESASHAVVRATSVVSMAAGALAKATARGAADKRSPFWEQIRADARSIAEGNEITEMRLWTTSAVRWFNEADRETRAIWAADPPGTWDFWLRWWDGVLSGNQVNWDLQRDIVLELTEEDWTAGPARVAERIAEIEGRYAIAATPNAETMQINPETGRLRLVPDSDLSADILTYAGRKIARAVALFGLHPANQYTAIAPELAMLREAQADASNLPVELFDVCASVSRRVTLRVTNGECPGPEQDAVVADFLSRIREAGADILANDPKTQDVLSRRNAILGNTALVEGKAALVEVSNKIATLAEGRLATALPLDATLATDSETNIADIKDASFRLTGRLLRFSKFVAVGVGSTGGAVIALKEVLEAIPAIQASPIFQQAMQYVLRYLGF